MANGSVTIDLRAQIVGYEASLKELQNAAKKVDIGSDIGKSLTRAISQAEGQLKTLSKNLIPRASNDTQVDAIIDKVNNLGDAIQTVAALMQQVGTVDLNFDAFGDGISNLQKQIATLETEFIGKLGAGMQTFVAQSNEVKNVFDNILKIDAKGKSPTELFDAIAKGTKKATTEVSKLEATYNKAMTIRVEAEKNLAKQEASPLTTMEGVEELRNKIKGYQQEYNAIFSTLNQNMIQSLTKNLKGKTGINQQELLNKFFGGLTVDNIKNRIKELYASLHEAGIYNIARDFYNQIFEAYGGATNIDQLVRRINLGDSSEVIERLRSFVNTFSANFSNTGNLNIFRLINSNSINEAVNVTLKEIDAAYGKAQTGVKAAKKELEKAVNAESSAQTNLRTAKANQTAIVAADTSLRNELKRLQDENTILRQNIETLKQQREEVLQTNVQALHSQAAGANIGAQQWKLGEDAALKYKDALEQVHAREQLVGRVQGVVQRWFSIYTAVNMVGNAVRSVISTIQELDKTITEIAIVTDMSQSDLWGQMDRYTEMARSYAASISGVYQVSQLFYQQGKFMV